MPDPLRAYPLLTALSARRSRRFGRGLTLDSGPLAYRSEREPAPLSPAEEAALVFAAAGVTGHAFVDLPLARGDAGTSGHGSIVRHLYGRTAASGDAIHAVSLFVINDRGTWFVRRPQDFPPERLDELVALAQEQRFSELYEVTRVQIADHRVDVSRALPHTPPFNKWSANQPGTTCFVPVEELTAFYINILLTIFEPEFGFWIVDDANLFRPAGIGRFARSKGGHLDDRLSAERTVPLSTFESWMYEFVAIEQGGMIQNLGLMAAALGLGGFAYFAHHPWAWMEAFGFEMGSLPASRAVGANPLLRLLIRLSRRDMAIPTPLGLSAGGVPLIVPFCPPHYPTMEAAVHAFVESKYGAGGSLRDPVAAGAWQQPEAVTAAIPRASDEAIAATVAFASYVYRRFGRFPATNGPFRTVTAYQAFHIDESFYERFYRTGQTGVQPHECLSE